MNNLYTYVPMLVTIVGVLTFVTNIVVEVLKNFTYNKVPTNLVALVVAMLVTIVSFFAFAQISGIVIEWYMVAGAIFGGFFVSYAAMFGFDKLKEMINQNSKLIG